MDEFEQNNTPEVNNEPPVQPEVQPEQPIEAVAQEQPEAQPAIQPETQPQVEQPPLYAAPAQPIYYQANDLPNQGEYTTKKGNIGFSIASMVLGIVSILICCCEYISIPLAIAAIVLGIIVIVKKYDGKGMAIAGIITGGVALFAVISLIVMSASPEFKSTIDDFMTKNGIEYEQYMDY